MHIELSPEVAAALAREAERRGKTPDEVANEAIRGVLRMVAELEPDEATENGTLFDFLGEFIGYLDSGSDDPETARLSENTGEKFTEMLLEDQRRIAREGTERTMAEFIEGHIGVFDSREDQPGGARMSEDIGRKFADEMARKRQQGHL